MYLKDKSVYMSGLTKMASFNMGPSYIDADCMEINNFKEAFAEMYEFPANWIEIKEEKRTLNELFTDLLQADKKVVDTLLHWIYMEAGRCIQVYKADNKELFEALSREQGGLGPFYFLEEIYFVQFERMVICFMVGNDE